ncbi:hypothetical protein QRD02_04085 [Aequorivita sp. SDUM287046]|uniref:DUF4136 domain-containing protein n=1 Tax=Aequorivita aurantiaca TaxID=3053356 RepID=A0ABT8DFS7_9FLAO|nr:hypothetical protein [Aequorivita aurantiaca]MDN3723549.1 hypothetical protein [Aequorivita aurantiaca]
MKKIILIFGFLSFLIISCATPYLQSSTNVSKVKKKYDKILIFANSKDKTTRLQFENQMVQDFAAQGIKAFSSMAVIQTNSFSKQLNEKDVEELRAKLVADGYTGVIITNLLSKDQYSDVVSGGTSTAYVPMRYGRFGRYYGAYPVNYWEPDQVQIGTEYTLESCLYDITESDKDNLQWVGRFQVKDPSSLTGSIEKYSKELVDQLLLENIAQ